MAESKSKAITDLLYITEHVEGMALKPEALPIFQTSAYTMNSMDEVKATYAKKEKGFTYTRKRNPNRTALERAITYMEGGEDTLCFSCAMGAIMTLFLHELKCGDHVLCNANIYGETEEILNDILKKFGVECDYVDFSNLDEVVRSVKKNTRILFTEVLSNPTLTLTDIKSIAEIAHSNGALLCVDNTFTTPIAVKPYTLGADYVINSLTKFINGHSDASGGSMTSSASRLEVMLKTGMKCGTTSASPFDSWLITRGLQTMDLRVKRQMENAVKLVRALEDIPCVEKVYHPSAHTYAQKALADKMFRNGRSTAILSFVVSEDMEKINEFMKRLKFAHYAPTLGGIRTTLSHPVTSSHASMPDEERRRIGITPGMIRVSVGIEDADDLIADFRQALEVFA